jgi:hypothetical protein
MGWATRAYYYSLKWQYIFLRLLCYPETGTCIYISTYYSLAYLIFK